MRVLGLLLAISAGREARAEWGPGDALHHHKHVHKAAVMADEAGGGADVATTIDKSFHAAKMGWDDAKKECAADGRHLCSLAEYCQGGAGFPDGGGQPLNGAMDGDFFAAIADLRGEYISVGTAMANERLCKTHSHCCGGLPGWGTTREAGWCR